MGPEKLELALPSSSPSRPIFINEEGDAAWISRILEIPGQPELAARERLKVRCRATREKGKGRFVVLSRDGEPEPNLVWKDTALVPAGRTVDILLDVSNPGLWMAHCRIAEHAQSGMMFSFDVSRSDPAEMAT